MTSVSYVSAYFHCVFSTKERRPLITPALRGRLWPFLGGIARQNKMKAIEIGAAEDTDLKGTASDQGWIIHMGA